MKFGSEVQKLHFFIEYRACSKLQPRSVGKREVRCFVLDTSIVPEMYCRAVLCTA